MFAGEEEESRPDKLFYSKFAARILVKRVVKKALDCYNLLDIIRADFWAVFFRISSVNQSIPRTVQDAIWGFPYLKQAVFHWIHRNRPNNAKSLLFHQVLPNC